MPASNAGRFVCLAPVAGRIILEQCLLRGMQRLPVALSDTTDAFARSLFSQISRFVQATARLWETCISRMMQQRRPCHVGTGQRARHWTTCWDWCLQGTDVGPLTVSAVVANAAAVAVSVAIGASATCRPALSCAHLGFICEVLPDSSTYAALLVSHSARDSGLVISALMSPAQAQALLRRCLKTWPADEATSHYSPPRPAQQSQTCQLLHQQGSLTFECTPAGYQLPVWFCVACPAVLGLLAPLLINAAAGGMANAACEHYHLPQADCAELW